MKKLVLIALMATTAFAQQHMIQFYGFGDGMTADSFDVTLNSNDADSKTNTTNIALNYAYTITPEFQLGFTYRSYMGEKAGADVNTTTIGLNGFWNLDSDIKSSKYLALRYWMTNYGEPSGTFAKDDKVNDIIVEFGKRFQIGSAMGLNLTYSPNVQLGMNVYAPDADGADDVNTTTVTWNWLKFDLLF